MIRTRFYESLLLIFSISLVACGTLEVGVELDAPLIERTPPSNSSGVLQFMMTPTPVPPPLQVAFVKEGNVWLWTTEKGKALPLTEGGDVNDSNVRISDDGRVIAFTKGSELWMVRNDGTDEQVLVSSADLDALEPADPGVALYRYEWIPGTHTLAFNTRLQTQHGLTPTNDLYLIDTDTLELSMALPPGEGGTFHYAPDGQQVAIVSAGTISLMDTDGGNRRDSVLTYAPARTPADERFHAQPVWAADSSFLRVAIIPADPMAQPAQLTTIWHIPTDGTPGTLITSIDAEFFQPIIFSPDLTQVLYFKTSDDTTAPSGRSEMLLTNLESGETKSYPEADIRISGWSPDSRHFSVITFDSDSQSIVAEVGQPNGELSPVEVDTDLGILDLRWIDARSYILLAISMTDGSWSLLQGTFGTPGTVLATIPQSPTSDVPPYDFAQ